MSMIELEADLLHVEVDAHVARVRFDAPPTNVITWSLVRQLRAACDAAAADDDVRVVTFCSDDPEFWLAHFDVESILSSGQREEAKPGWLHPFHRMCLAWRAIPKPTIAVIEGRVGGGGAEFASALDMRFGTSEGTLLNQMEVPLGIIPGGGGTQYLPALVGYARACEVILGGGDVDGPLAAAWGWLNRCVPRSELPAFVTELCGRLARFDPEAVARAKQALRLADAPLEPRLGREADLFDECAGRPRSKATMRRFLELGGQTRDGERRVADLAAEANG